MLKIFFISLLLSIFSAHAVAATYTDEQTWVNANAFFKLNENWNAYAEWQPRFFDYSRYNGVTLHRTAIGRNIGHGLSLYGGYGFIVSNTRHHSKAPSTFQHEDRFFGMLIHNHSSGNWKLTNRTRYEFRQFRHEDEWAERFRHMVRGQYKFGEKPWAIAVWDEYFYNPNTTALTKAGFDQNRAFVGAAYFFGKNQRHMLETGFMNNFVSGASRNRLAHVWMTTLAFNF